MLLGIDSAVARLIADADCSLKRKQIFSQSVFLIFLSLISIVPILYYFRESILINYIGDSSHSYLFSIVLCNLFLYLFIQNILGIFKWMFEKVNYFILSFGHALLTILVSLLLLVELDYGLIAIFYGQLLSSLFFCIVGFLLARKYLTFTLGKSYMKAFFNIGIPVCLISCLGCLIPILERNFISKYLSLSDIAVYSVALKIVLILVLITNTFNTAWSPFALSIYKKQNSNIIFNKIFLYTSSFLFLIVLLLSFFSQSLIEILAGSNYYESSILVSPLLLSRFYTFSSRFISVGIYIKKKNFYLVIPQVIYIATFFIVTPIFIQKDLILGFCKAILICSLISFFIHLILVHKISEIRFKVIYYIPVLLFTWYSVFDY